MEWAIEEAGVEDADGGRDVDKESGAPELRMIRAPTIGQLTGR